MLLKVANDDVVSFRNNNDWLVHHPNEALIFKSLDEIWDELKATYNGDFKTMVYGTLPNDDDVLATLKRLKERMKSINWDIRVDE